MAHIGVAGGMVSVRFTVLNETERQLAKTTGQFPGGFQSDGYFLSPEPLKDHQNTCGCLTDHTGKAD